jgi:glycine reductase complex component B subunit gamma
VIAKEIENAGIPTAIITTLVPTALLVGASRIIPGLAITHPVGNPDLSASEEKEARRTIVLKALESLQGRAF